jgi:formate/nitrite transporter FocA (FNT family)
MIVGYASRRITSGALLRAWSLVYVGKTALAIAAAKAALSIVQLSFLAVLCNVLVCLAVWMSFGSRTTTDKMMVIVPPIAAFVAAGFEHSIANP